MLCPQWPNPTVFSPLQLTRSLLAAPFVNFYMSLNKYRIILNIFLSKIALVVIVLLTDIALARIMSVSDRGAILSLNSTIFFLASCITFGLEYGFLIVPNLPSLESVLRVYLKAIPKLFFCGIFISLFVAYRYKLGVAETIFISLLMLCEILSILVLPCILQYRSATNYGLIRVARRLLALIIMIFVFLMMNRSNISLQISIICFAVAWSTTLLYALFIIRSSIPHSSLSTKGNNLSYRKLIQPGSAIFLAKFCERFQTQVGLIILGFFGFKSSASLFAIGAQATEVAVFASGSISIGLLAKKGSDNILKKNEVKRVLLCIFVLAFLGTVLIWPFLLPIILGLYGNNYAESASLVKIIAPILIFYSGYPLVSTYLLRRNMKRLVLFGNLTSTMANIAYCVVAIRVFDMSPHMAATQSLFFALSLNLAIVVFGYLMNIPWQPKVPTKQ